LSAIRNQEIKDESSNVSMNILDVSAGGLSFYLENTSDNVHEVYTYSLHYSIFVRKNGLWELIEPVGIFDDEGYYLMPQTKTDVTAVNWHRLYGELPAGQYRFEKSILRILLTGEYEAVVLSQDFTITS
jgi:hypothetical protein